VSSVEAAIYLKDLADRVMRMVHDLRLAGGHEKAVGEALDRVREAETLLWTAVVILSRAKRQQAEESGNSAFRREVSHL